MDAIAFTVGFILTNILWMVFYIFTGLDEKKSNIVIKRIEPIIKATKKKSKEEKEAEEEANPFKGMSDLMDVPIDDVKKGMLS